MEQTPFDRAVAKSEEVLGRSLSLPERRLLRTLPAATCESIAAGRRTLESESEKASNALVAELAGNQAAVQSVDADAAYADAARIAAAEQGGDDDDAASLAYAQYLEAEQVAEAEEFKARARLAARRHAPPRQPVTQFQQLQRLPTGEAVPAVVWTWKETDEGGAWFAPDVPDEQAMTHLRVVCLSDTHGCHGMLERYWDSHAHVLENAHVLVLTGDCWEHEGATPEEQGRSLLEYEKPPVSRNLGEWLLSKYNIKYKVTISGNHDTHFLHAETAALKGTPAPGAGDPGREYMESRSCPCLYIQDEAAVIPMGKGRRLIIYGTPWQTDIGGLFQYSQDELEEHGVATGISNADMLATEFTRKTGRPTAKTEIKRGTVSELVRGPWGVGEQAHIVLSHSPPSHILDTVNGGVLTGRKKPPPKGLNPCGCPMLLESERRVQPLLAVHGHVHAEQGLSWLEWKTKKPAIEWRQKGTVARQERSPYPPVPDCAPRKGSLRAVHGRDLSDVHAAKLPADGSGPGGLTRAALERDFKNTLFVNAANLNATISSHQHGQDPKTGKVTAPNRGAEGEGSRMRALRPPIVVDVYPQLPGEPRSKGRAELIPLGIPRFPEF
jgi:Icc-related predicted phosphoesterase